MIHHELIQICLVSGLFIHSYINSIIHNSIQKIAREGRNYADLIFLLVHCCILPQSNIPHTMLTTTRESYSILCACNVDYEDNKKNITLLLGHANKIIVMCLQLYCNVEHFM